MEKSNLDIDKVWALMAQEGRQNLSLAEEKCLSLKKDPGNRGDIFSLFLALHGFKGIVRIMNFSITETLAHHAECLVALVKDEGVVLDGEMIDLLLITLDMLRFILDFILANHTDVDPAEVAVMISKLAEMEKLKKSQLNEFDSVLNLTGEIIAGNQNVSLLEAQKEQDDTALAAKEANQKINENLGLKLPPVEEDQFTAGRMDSKTINENFNPEIIAFEPFNLPENSENIKSFLETVLPEMTRLHAALDNLQGYISMNSDLTPVRLPLETIKIAAEQMQLTKLGLILQEFLEIIEPERLPFEESVLTHLWFLEKKIIEEINLLAPSNASSEASGEREISQSDLFYLWYNSQVEGDIQDLERIIKELSQFEQPLTPLNTHKKRELAEVLHSILARIYHICIFYHIDIAATLTLALEDLSARIWREEAPITDSFINLLHIYSVQMRKVLVRPIRVRDKGGKGYSIDPTFSLTCNALISLTRQIIILAGNPKIQVARKIVESLFIPSRIKSGLTDENLAEICQTLQAGQKLFIIHVKMDEDQSILKPFMQWINSGMVTPIYTNSIDEANPNQIICLVSSAMDLESNQKALLKIDPQSKYLVFSDCRFLPGTFTQ